MRVLLIVVWLGLAAGLSLVGGGETESGKSAQLPASAESMVAARFTGPPSLPGVLVYEEVDLTAIRADARAISDELGGVLAGSVEGPVVSEDGQAAYLVVRFAGTDSTKYVEDVDRLREIADTAYLTGPVGMERDMKGAIAGIDLFLVVVTSVVILLILVVVYRSPLLPFLVLAVAGTALMVAMGVLAVLTRLGVLTVSAEVQGIFSVLVLGAGTDYALLVVARYREDGSVRVAVRQSMGAIVTSAGIVVAALLCLLFSDLGLNRSLGPAGAIGVVCAALAMVTLLPAVLSLFGRAVFWPRRSVGESKGWAWVAERVGRRPRALWIGTALVLGVLALGVLRLDARGLTVSEQLLDRDVDSVVGQTVLSAHFPGGEANPVVVVARDGSVAEVVRGVPGVDSVSVRPGLILATLSDGPDTHAAQDTVVALRNEVDGPVGGYAAVQVDFHAEAAGDRSVIPLVLLVVLVLLMMLLRSVVAPLLLVATVVLSYLAAVGVSAVVFQDLLGFSGVDSTYPVHTVVFLVALGVDYTIFLMTRVREETGTLGTRAGTLRALVVTGGVITSAGVVLAATFSALALMPLVLLVELAFTVSFGVLLDTLVVRTVLVPALAVDLGPRIWWPSRR
jgi:RND superfamily putative drug exporter